MTGALFRGGRVIDPASGVDGPRDLLVRDGKVAEVAERIAAPPNVEVVDAEGLWVLPGFIDLHVHLREPGETHKETIRTGTRAAVAGGFTSVVAMPNTRPANDCARVTELILARAREAELARVYPAGAITRGLDGEVLAELGELAEAGCVAVTDDGRPVMRAGLMRRALQYAKGLNLPVMVHEEDLSLSGPGVMNESVQATRLGLLPIPASAEVSMVARDLTLLEETGGRLHFAHLSCEGSVRRVREAKRRGLPVTAEAAPHHFTLTDDAVGEYDTKAKMNPPLRSRRDVEAIREGLADGTIDAIATDHAPHGSAEKAQVFASAPNGIIGLETALPLTLALVRGGVLEPARAVALLTHGPATVFGLPGGRLSAGSPADMALVDPAEVWTCDAARLFSKSRNTPFDGWTFTGRVVETWVGGRRVFRKGEIEEMAR